ncbi:unnamed protein product [Echinostoma caproni]|uniref:Hydroxysteroid dehydrogenase-like protein 2 n=1 Tax=Echinostoma caproni TaxID=27848 RepID=A0A183B6E1_9TREM|nr:unnamed protein product [Echinostoma caproni]
MESSKICIPYLKQSSNPHILTLSPPLNMLPKWFSNHLAYSMSKYAMSMTVLGLAKELQPLGIAVNALWPRTAIYTAATKMIGGGEKFAELCRRPEIMADAAYAILTLSAKEVKHTGNFYVDDEVLREHGVTDFEQYAVKPVPEELEMEGKLEGQKLRETALSRGQNVRLPVTEEV